ncbi:MAG: MFS transporter [Lachnospiraceae bacterium]
MATYKKRHTIIILTVASSYNAIYSIAFMKSLYYTLMQSGLHLTHFQLGQLYSAFGLFSMFSYLCGAFFLNRFSKLKLLSGTSMIVGVLTFSLAFVQSYTLYLIMFGIIGFLIGSTFYPAHLEVLHHLGSTANQGAVFSLFFVCNNAFGILFAAIGFGISSLPISSEQIIRYLLIFFALLNILTAFLISIFLRSFPENEQHRVPISFSSVKELFNNKRLWYVILIVMSNYVIFSQMNYIMPYLGSRFALPHSLYNILSIIRVYCIGIFAAPIAGKITDCFHKASRLMQYSFLMHSFVIIIMLLFFRQNILGTIICLMLICLSANMGKSMALVTIDEARIASHLYGMAISFISFCAYSPDAFYYSVSGCILDICPFFGYEYVFLIAAIISFIGAITSHKLQRIK